MSALVLGCEGVGKSLLIRQCQGKMVVNIPGVSRVNNILFTKKPSSPLFYRIRKKMYPRKTFIPNESISAASTSSSSATSSSPLFSSSSSPSSTSAMAPSSGICTVDPNTQSTSGVNISECCYDGVSFELKEVGGPMRKSWPVYYASAAKVIFVVDASRRWQLAASVCALYTLLEDPVLEKTPFILVFNKCDSAACMELREVHYLLRLEEVMQCATQRITVLTTSAFTGQGIPTLCKQIAGKA